MGAAGGAWSHGNRFTDLAHACQSWWSISGNHCDDLRPLPRAVMYLTLAYHARGRTKYGGEIPPVRTRPGDRSDRDAGGSGRRGRALMCLGPGRRALAARGRYGHCTWARRLRNGHSLGTLKISGPPRRRRKSVRGCGAAHGSVPVHTDTHYAHAARMHTPRRTCTTYI